MHDHDRSEPGASQPSEQLGGDSLRNTIGSGYESAAAAMRDRRDPTDKLGQLPVGQRQRIAPAEDDFADASIGRDAIECRLPIGERFRASL